MEGGSAIVTCTAEGITVKAYVGVEDCKVVKDSEGVETKVIEETTKYETCKKIGSGESKKYIQLTGAAALKAAAIALVAIAGSQF